VYDGLEVDMLSLGDADCIVVTQYPVWHSAIGPQRVLIDGGKEGDAPLILDFLRSRNMTNFWAAICTHSHNDHARGLVKILEHPSITVRNGWMHDIRRHISIDDLRRASSGNSEEADAVKQVWNNTRDLARAFALNNVQPTEPFAGANIAYWPSMNVLGPSISFYRELVQDLVQGATGTFERLAAASAFSELFRGSAGGSSAVRLSSLMSTTSPSHGNFAPFISGVLRDSSVAENPTTQPFNNTSTILGVSYRGERLLFTGDAGSEALDNVPADWCGLTWLQLPHHGSDGNLSQHNIERFCPKTAFVSARGDTSHPSMAIVNGLLKLNAQVFSTHKNPNHLLFFLGNVPQRADYGPAVALKGSVEKTIDLRLLGLISNLR